MLKRHIFLHCFSRDRSGATLVEFAIIAPIFFLMLFSIIEYGLVMFSSVVIESAVMHASRVVSIGADSGSGACANSPNRVENVKCIVRQKTSGLIHADSVLFVANPVAQGGLAALSKPDICLFDPPQTPKVGGPCPQGTKWQDLNGNGVYDAGPGEATPASLGGAGELVEIRVYYPWKVQIPFVQEFFGCRTGGVAGCEKGVIMITSATVLKNEPF